MIDIQNKKIIIHSYSYGPDSKKGLQIADTAILLYYLSNDFFEHAKEWHSERYAKEKGYTKEGYVIEAKIKAVRNPMIKYITEDYFTKTYKELEKINFEELARENIFGCDGGGVTIEIGTTYTGTYNYKYKKELSLWCPHVSEDDKQSDLYKLLNIINLIEKKINFGEWYNKYYKEWEKWEERIKNYDDIFQYRDDEEWFKDCI
jgi:hypothetical protein